MTKKHNDKNYIDKELFEEIMIAMKKSKVPNEVFSIAKKMDAKIVSEFKRKIIDVPNDKDEIEENRKYYSKNLLGIYGNYFATFYYGSKYKVENEKSVYNENKELIGKADLFFYDEDGNENYCEVKATPFIYGYQDGFSQDKEVKKYQKIGQKLIKQVAKLRSTNSNVIVILFNGCKVDEEIIKKLEVLGAEIKYLEININMLERFIDDLVDEIEANFYNKKNNLNERKIS